jgi:ABC-type uncharacterized transport system substrate-binding protein
VGYVRVTEFRGSKRKRDPVGQGFIESLSRPGGNVTGFINLEASVAGKYLELLKEIAPHVVATINRGASGKA